ncbi:hypothetical protein ACLKA7_010002 [Drosophila subpalustris]
MPPIFNLFPLKKPSARQERRRKEDHGHRLSLNPSLNLCLYPCLYPRLYPWLYPCLCLCPGPSSFSPHRSIRSSHPVRASEATASVTVSTQSQCGSFPIPFPIPYRGNSLRHSATTVQVCATRAE